ncbi:MAG: ABC transporter ATP-binding protein [Deltaproteobacteria bacterium]|nr:ABC transporter ATP-binding protein [Deltaproteobacteria bacterium]
MGIRATGLQKRFGDTPVIRGIDLDVANGELVALLGPSGGGKSTLLRLIAGLEPADAGEVWLDGRRVDHLDAASRGVGFVFQHYALFRHLTVEDNVAFGLRVRGVERREAREQARALLTRVGLEGLGPRWPHALSGGQRQRVALARALAPAPRVLLLDEPFGALDARVRADLRDWLRRLHDEVGATTILVTHDQEEAMAVADRVLIIRDGLVEQAGTPAQLLDQPRTEFVASFIGEVNVFEGIVGEDRCLEADGVRLPVGRALAVGQRARAVVRSHQLRLTPGGPATVLRVVPMDDRARVEVAAGDRVLLARLSRDAVSQAGIRVGSEVTVEALSSRAWAGDGPPTEGRPATHRGAQAAPSHRLAPARSR